MRNWTDTEIGQLLSEPLPILPSDLTEDEKDELCGRIVDYCRRHDAPEPAEAVFSASSEAAFESAVKDAFTYQD